MLNMKKISKSGTITVPAHIRRELGIEQGERFEIERSGKDLSLRRIEGRCIVCRSSEDLLQVQDVYVCRLCATIINDTASK